jgi:hypothetical protein
MKPAELIPQSPDAVAPETRVATILVTVEILYFAASGSNRPAEIGLALILGGTLLATPSLIERVISSSHSRKPLNVYLRIVGLLATTGVVLSVLGVRGGHIQLPPGDSLKLVVLLITATGELVLFALIPIWFAVTGRDLMPERWRRRVLSCLRWVAQKPKKWYERLEAREWFALLGGLLFMAGVLMQFIAGS